MNLIFDLMETFKAQVLACSAVHRGVGKGNEKNVLFLAKNESLKTYRVNQICVR